MATMVKLDAETQKLLVAKQGYLMQIYKRKVTANEALKYVLKKQLPKSSYIKNRSRQKWQEKNQIIRMC